MATYYVRKTGSDGAAGTSAATAWLTVQKALNAATLVNGDQVWVGAGTYREFLTCSMTTPTSVITITADVDGKNTGDAGEVIISAYATNDTTAPTATNLLTLNGKNFLTWQKFTFVGDNSIVTCSATPAHHITFSDCTFIDAKTANTPAAVNIASNAGTALVWVIERCRFLASQNSNGMIAVDLTRPTGADFDYDVQIRDCFGVQCSGPFVQVTASGANTFNGGGVDVFGCTFIGDSAILKTNTALNLSTSIPCTLTNSFHLGGSAAPVNAATSGQITENNNILFTATARTNVTAGGSTILGNTRAPLVSLGQEATVGANLRHFFAPLASSPLLGFGTATGASTTDLLNRIKPSGAAASTPAAGALERHDFAIAPGTTVGADSGTGYIELVGYGDQDFEVPVDATATTFTIKVKTSGYSGTNYPQMLLVNGGEAGVADQTITATSASASAYESISTASFTPTSKGIVTVRLVNRSANGTGIAAFDTFSVS